MKAPLLTFALFAVTAGVVVGYPLHRNDVGITPPAAPPPALPVSAHPNARPKVEVVFVLDTTGSMGGLIQAAKENIWSIASSMAAAQPTPEIRLGLVAYRDRGDDFVTRIVDLSSDLDSIYATLMEFRANGGGDGPESVNQALHDAVHRISWSQDEDSYKVIFLVGDAPPHMDYPDDVKYPETLKVAGAKGIVVNTIQAGDDADAQREWRQIAGLNQGQYFQVGQSGSAVAVATPFDEELARLSQALDATRLFYGDADKQRELARKEALTDQLHASGSAASRAKRAAFNASAPGASNFLGESELVDDITRGRVDLASVDQTHLPEFLRNLDPQAQARLIEQTAARRAELRARIQALSAQRRRYIDTKLKDTDAEETSLDYQIFNTVKMQAAEKGLRYQDAPAY
jgi:Mg-chelatase subunit ChlD